MATSNIPPHELLIETAHYEPKGGQSVGVIQRDIIVTHIPTGLKARCGVERSQTKNRDIALAMLEYGLAEIGWEFPTSAATPGSAASGGA